MCSIENAIPTTKKAKKALYKNATAAYTTTDINDQAALNRRAERFQREHELEKTKHSRSAGAVKANQHYSHLYSNLSRSGSPYATTGDDPEADPVSEFISVICLL